MSYRNRYYSTGSAVSQYLSPANRAWTDVLLQSAHAFTDAEANLIQDIQGQSSSANQQIVTPSGFLYRTGDLREDYTCVGVGDPLFYANTFLLAPMQAFVAGHLVDVQYTNLNQNGINRIILDSPPVFGGTAPDVKRTDFVFLEVWLAVVSFSPHAVGTVTVNTLPSAGDTVVVGGVPLTAVAGAPGVDQFMVGVDEIITAANIMAAINDPGNSFLGLITANSNSTSVVDIRAAAAGAAGNAITLSVASGALSVSGATLSGGVDQPNKPSQGTLYWGGNTQCDSSMCLLDDIADPIIDAETTKRVQLQYRVRVTGQSEAVNFKTETDGFSSPNVFAQGGQTSPVSGYPFVKADRFSTSGNSSAPNYGAEDCGLWVAGDGSSGSATALGSVDGFVYAVPICFVHRRNDASGGVGFDPLNNTNGALPYNHTGIVNPAVGTIPPGVSDRPDGEFADVIVLNDIEDKRKHVSLTGWDWTAELQYQMDTLLAGQNQTWTLDASDKNTLGAGSGDVSVRYLVCDQFGRTSASGGVIPSSGDTTRGSTVRNLDHVARRFGCHPIVERVVWELYPTYTNITYPGRYVEQANVGYAGWAEDDALHIDLSTLNATTLGSWDPLTQTYVGTVADFSPPGLLITDVLSIHHDDGDYNNATDTSVAIKTVTGLGTDHVIVVLDRNDTSATGGENVAAYRLVGDSGTDNGSPRRIFVELELSYPAGSYGLTDTPAEMLQPDPSVYLSGAVLENDATQRPLDMEFLIPPQFREGFREVKLEYMANNGTASTPISDTLVSRDRTQLVFPRRIANSATVTDSVSTTAMSIASVEEGSSSRLVTLNSNLSGVGCTKCDVTYFAQDPLPNYGAIGYQIGVYYRTQVKPTVGVMSGGLSTLPATLSVTPLAISAHLWAGQTGLGSGVSPFPFASPLEVIPVNDGGTSTFPGEWHFQASADISTTGLNASTGMLSLQGLVPGVLTGRFTFTGKSKDVEFRAFYEMADTSTYRPTIMATGLSDVSRHKVFIPLLAKAVEDTVLYRKGEVLLIVLSRWAELDAENSIRFVDVDNRTCAALYRTQNLLLCVG